MPKRRRTAVGDSDESEEVSENEFKEEFDEDLKEDFKDDVTAGHPSASESDTSTAPRSRSQRRKLEASEPEEKADDEENQGGLHWPVVLKTNKDKKPKQPTSDDEYTESSDEDEDADSDIKGSDEEFEFSDGGFVVDSDDNVVPSRRANSRSRRRSAVRNSRGRRPRGRPARAARRKKEVSDEDDGDSDDEFSGSEGSIAEELRELKGQNSPTRRNRNYRARAPVNYAIPPPPTIEEVAQATAQAAEAVASSKNRDSRIRRLFDVRGPFGGTDVHSIFNLNRQDLEKVVDEAKAAGDKTDPASLAASLENARLPSDGTPAANVGTNADVDPVDSAGDVDFSMVGGLDSYIAKLKEMVSLPLLYPELYEKFGITPPRGVLFHGPPGTGKTLMARALAASHKQEKVTFYMRKGADVLSKWIGESERQLRALFDEARAHQPSIIFFDEIDGLAPVRSARQEQHHASIVSTLLALMDGMDNRGQVVVIGATNRPDSVDPALRRPGRFDREFYFPLPDMDARQRILEIHTKNWQPPLPKPLLSSIAEQTKGFGGADLRALTTEAALLAIHRAYPQIYGSAAKLAVDPATISVRPQDFTLALERIQPSTSRAAGVSLAQPLPPRVEPLLRSTLLRLSERVRTVFPTNSKESETATLFLDGSDFSEVQEVKHFSQSRIHRPRLLLQGTNGNGQSYLLRAVAHLLEGVYVREISVAAIFGSAAGSAPPESAIVNAVTEARQRAPSCILIPSLNEWATAGHLESLLAGLLKSLLPSERIFVIGSDEVDHDGDAVPYSPLRSYFGADEVAIKLDRSEGVLSKFFEPIFTFIRRSPLKCREAQELPQPEPPKLAEISAKPADTVKSTELSKDDSATRASGRVLNDTKRLELKVRSQLKLKLGLILDGFRQKYRRFRKPVIEEQKLAYLFESPSPPKVSVGDKSVLTADAKDINGTNDDASDPPGSRNMEDEEEDNDDEVLEPYVLTEDNMILDRVSNKKYFNMDLETVEDRLWNGFYCEPEQFLEDMEMIYRDAAVFGERERMHKASEMLANAQVAIDDISIDKQFTAACRSLHVKDAQARLREMEEPSQVEKANSEAHKESGEEASSNIGQEETSHNETRSPLQSNGHILEPPASLPPTETHAMDVDISSSTPAATIDASDDRREVSFDAGAYGKFSARLISAASNLSLEDLEQLFASLSDISWRHRKDWDRTSMIQSMTAHVQLLEATSST